MTRKVFWENPYLSELDTHITHVIGADVTVERRYWEIAGFARVGCGGTHLRRTGEVGEMTLKRNNIGKGKERIEIYLA